MRSGAGSELGETPRKSVGFETIATCSVRVRSFSNHFAAEQGGLRPPYSFLFFSLGMLGSQRWSCMRKLSRKFQSP